MHEQTPVAAAPERADLLLVKYFCITGLVLLAIDALHARQTGGFVVGSKWSGIAGIVLGATGLVAGLRSALLAEDRAIRRNLALLALLGGALVAAGVVFALA
jgi:hypothetical protein